MGSCQWRQAHFEPDARRRTDRSRNSGRSSIALLAIWADGPPPCTGGAKWGYRHTRPNSQKAGSLRRVTASIRNSTALLFGGGELRFQDLGRARIHKVGAGIGAARERGPFLCKFVPALPGVDFCESGLFCNDIRICRDIRLCEELLCADRSEDRDCSRLRAVIRYLFRGAAGDPAKSRAEPVEADSNRQDEPGSGSLKKSRQRLARQE